MKIIIELPDELAEMFGDMAGALQTIAKVVTVKVVQDQATVEEQSKAVFNKPSEATQEQPTVSIEEVRAKLVDLSRSGKREQAKALLQEFGAVKLTEVPKEKLPDLLAKVEAIA
jgi:hypothetical protein